jgi:two-component system CheB/CheR fusion protein
VVESRVERNGESLPVEAAARFRVLVVDDNRDAATTLALLLRARGHEVQVANDGHAALELAESFRPQVVLLDIGLPGIDGYEVARRLRSSPRTRDILIVAISGYGQDEDRKRSQQVGFDFHLVKPVDPAVLQSLLTSATVAAAETRISVPG